MLWVWILPVWVLGLLSGWVLFRRVTIPAGGDGVPPPAGRLSVIVPARNEERNLPHLLQSLREQTLRPYEVIVVDDCSTDRTREIAESFGVTVISIAELPPGWTGKNWAIWNGYKRSSGDLIAFLDADIRLAPEALEALAKARERTGGVVSVVPYHVTEKWHERLALVTNILGIFAFASPFERRNPRKGLYGSCILTSREDYEKVRGHESIRGEILDDLNLGARYRQAGIPVTNYLGRGFVSFRMYEQGLRSEIQGFGKGAALSTSTLTTGTIALTAVWLIGLLVSECAVFLWATSWIAPLLIGYGLYTLQIFYFVKYTGRFGFVIVPLHVLSGFFFVFVMLYSLCRVTFVGHVTWKGRDIRVGGR
jgi:hypothetical protein